MKVQELINRLREYPEALEVRLLADGEFAEFTDDNLTALDGAVVIGAPAAQEPEADAPKAKAARKKAK